MCVSYTKKLLSDPNYKYVIHIDANEKLSVGSTSPLSLRVCEMSIT